MIALIDCNNFYASCERLFRPDLRDKAIVVLSNNDGCIVARSNESKALGIPMGIPLFKVREQIRQHNIQVFSSNYTLYGDISHRVMKTIESYVPEIEVYSIDEAFVDLSAFAVEDLPTVAREIRQRVWDVVGIPVAVGVAATKTLAKIAGRIAKKGLLPHTQYGPNISVLRYEDDINQALTKVDVGDIWGVGRAHKRRLKSFGINTAWDFVQADANWIKRQMTITGWRTHQELLGHLEIPFNPAPPTPKMVIFSRSLESPLWYPDRIEERTLAFAQALAIKLRRKEVRAGTLSLYYSGGFSERGKRRKTSESLAIPSNDTREIILQVQRLMRRLLLQPMDFGVKRIALCAFDFEPKHQRQLSLFDTPTDSMLMEIIDDINDRFGRNTVTIGITSKQIQNMHGQQHNKSPRYTTRWSDILIVDIS